MTIEISKEARQQAIASIERYFRENMDKKIGNIAAGALLGFFLEEIGPLVYNQAVSGGCGGLVISGRDVRCTKRSMPKATDLPGAAHYAARALRRAA